MTTDEILAWLTGREKAERTNQEYARADRDPTLANFYDGKASGFYEVACHIRNTLAAESQRDTSGQTSAGDGAGE